MENPSFSVNDLLFIKNLIEVINQRGGFQPNEFVPVGEFYSRVVKFYEYSMAQMEQRNTTEKEDHLSNQSNGEKPKEK